MPEESSKKDLILQSMSEKSSTKQNVYHTTLEVFHELKSILQEIENEYNQVLQGADSRVLFSYKDNGIFEAELKFSGDILIFQMHSNVFEFNREHNIWKLSYVKDNYLNSFVGIINVYNFLSDSFKYKRYEDLGYLVGRIFINRDRHYFVEGKKQLSFLFNDFGKSIITREALKEIVETTISYALDFDLLVPPYEHVKLTSVGQVAQKRQFSKQVTGKRLGFQFNTDDID